MNRRLTVTAWAGLALGRLENLKKGANITRPRDQEATNRNNEKDGVSTRVVTAWAGPAFVFEKKGGKYIAPPKF